MKKRSLLIIGFFLLISTRSAHAMCPDSIAAFALLQTQPVGHYTKQVLDRADAGIAEAQGADDGEPNFGQNYFSWVYKITGAILGLVDTKLRLVEFERNLTQTSACLHLDLALMEAKMEQVRCETKVAAERGSTWGVMQLLALQNFLNERYKHLIEGAEDPYYTDPSWQSWEIFDPEEDVWCCANSNPQNTCELVNVKTCHYEKSGQSFVSADECSNFCKPPQNASQPPVREEICPFDSDYLPPTGAGYGCSSEIIGLFSFYIPAQLERQAISEFQQDRNEFLTSPHIQNLKNAYMRMLEFQGRPIPPELDNFGQTPDTPHVRRYDCGANQTPNGPVPESQKNTWPTGAIAFELRGPFSISKDEIFVLRNFFDLSRRWALLRELPDYLMAPYDLPPGQSRNDAIEREESLLGYGKKVREFVANLVLAISKNQAGLESAIFPKATDGQLRLIEIMEPVRPVIASLAKSVSSDQEGIRAFAKNYAYYLRRSCIFRSCSDRLDKIIKILLEDDCFPYASGEYTSGVWWERCENAIQ